MANEFVARNGFIAKANSTISGTLDVSGNITMGTALVATRSWVTGTALVGYATESYVNTAISNLTDSAPDLLNTLNELAAALGDDPNFATTVTNSIATKLPLAGGTMTGPLRIDTTGTALEITGTTTVDGSDVSIYLGNSPSDYGFYITYVGSGAGNTNAFRIQSTNAGTPKTLLVSNQDGIVNFPTGLQLNGATVATETFVTTRGYLTAESDPIFVGSPAYNIEQTNIDKWDLAFGWGDHAGLYAAASHTHSATNITSGTLAAARLSGNYAINVTGSAATLTTARTLTIGNTGKTFNGSANVSWSLAEIGAASSSHTHNVWDLAVNRTLINIDTTGSDNFWQYIHGVQTTDGTHPGAYTYIASFGDRSQGIQFSHGFGNSADSLFFRAGTDNPASENGAGVYTTWRQIASRPWVTSQNYITASASITGNAATATTLQTARTLTIGNTGKTFNGSANVSWTLAEIGALGATAKAADSNLLDGIDSSGFIRDYGTSAQANINTIGVTSGKYRWNSSTIGRPAEPQANEYGTLLHLNYDGDVTTQLAYDIAESNLYIRHLTTSTDTPSTWKRVVTSSDTIGILDGYTQLEVDNLIDERLALSGGTLTGGLNAGGGITGLTLSNGISGTNFNITGVNQLEIADPGEGIVFKAGSSGDMTLAIVDDSSDNILRFSGTNAKLQVGTNTVWHAGNLTNVSQLTNDAGYITDGNTGWNNTYGFITGLNWTDLGGDPADINLSQFTNDAGYITGYTETDTLATVTARGNTTTGSINVNGNILLTGTATTTNQARTIEFTGFDKEGTTDFSDKAYIQHTVNAGGHSGSVLIISSQNDSGDGIAFLTNASSKLKHNSNNIATEPWVTSQGYLTSSALSGYATTGYVDTAIANLVDTAPDALNTLNELATALGDDPNFATTVTNSIATKLPLAGGTMTGVIDNGTSNTTGYRFGGRSFSWNSAMQTPASNVPHIMQNSYGGWDPVIGIKTTNGFWQMGAYSNDEIHFGYMVGAFGSHPTNGFDYSYSVTPTTFKIGNVGTMNLTVSGTISASNFSGSSSGTNTGDQTTITGNAGSATVLQTARTLTIGNTGKNFNGSANVSWSLAEIGALGATAKAADSNLLDGIDSGSFLRSDTNDTASGAYTFSGQVTFTNNVVITEVAPTISLLDTESEDDFYIHVNSNNFYVLRNTSNTENIVDAGWDNPHPLQLEGDTNNAYIFGNLVRSAAYASTSDFDTVGAADAVNQRIDNEVIPAIPTDNSQLANGAGYITDGNTGWNNSYGFITASASITGNAATATKLATARNIALSGAVTGNANFDGSGNITIATTATSDPTLTLNGDVSGSATFTNLGNATLTVTIADDSHNHVISNVDGLQTALDGKLSTGHDMSLTLSGDASGSATFTNMANATLSVTVANDSHTHDGRYYTETESDARFVNVTGDTVTGNLVVSGASLGVISTSQGSEAFYVDGVNGRLFTINDDLSDSLFSVNTISGLPVIEAFADNRVNIGPFSNPVTVDTAGLLYIGGLQAATQSYVDTAITNLIGGAPGALDTLNELAAAINDDASYASTITSALALKAPLASPALTGTPTAPTASTATNSTQIATTAYVKNQGYLTSVTTISGNAGSATVLQTARTLTIGNTGKTFNGSANVSWSLAEIGALGATAKAADSNLLDGIDSGSFLRSDASDSFSGILTGTASGENLKVGGIRGTTKGSQTGEYIHLYERVHIGGPNGWGAATHNAPAYGLSTWGSVDFGMNGSGVIQLDGTTIVTAARALTNVTNTNWDAAYSWGNHADYGYWNTDLADPKNVQSVEVVFAGNVTVEGTFTESSSIRFKENIVDLESSTEKVEQLRPVRYNKIGVEEEEIGLIAEEVAEIYPEVVTYNEEGQPSGVNYTRLSVILLKSVQELAERINKLENK